MSIATATTVHRHGYWLDEGEGHHAHDDELAGALVQLFDGASVVDVGCGLGEYVKRFQEADIPSLGYDGNPATSYLTGARCCTVDFAQQLPRTVIAWKCRWVLSLEVGEHIPADYESTFLDNVVQLAMDGIVLSWAVPGHTGRGHVNCRSNDYIRHQMALRGWVSDFEIERELRAAARRSWFKETIMVFHPTKETNE